MWEFTLVLNLHLNSQGQKGNGRSQTSEEEWKVIMSLMPLMSKKNKGQTWKSSFKKLLLFGPEHHQSQVERRPWDQRFWAELLDSSSYGRGGQWPQGGALQGHDRDHLLEGQKKGGAHKQKETGHLQTAPPPSACRCQCQEQPTTSVFTVRIVWAKMNDFLYVVYCVDRINLQV